jgi:chaperone modulatory protein CbpM
MNDRPLSADVLDERFEVSLRELCSMCQLQEDLVVEMVAEGVIEPVDRSGQVWRFSGIAVSRVLRVLRLQQEFGVNLAGAALALELFEEIERLKRRV